MPKFIVDNPERTLLSLSEEGNVSLFTKAQVIKFLRGDKDFDFIDKGKSESIVVSRKGKPEEVIAINYINVRPEDQKGIFYNQRILSTLFPHNFPKFHTAVAGDRSKGQLSGTIRERVFQAEIGSQKILYPFSDVEETLKKIGADIYFDKEHGNIIVGIDGGEYFVDTVRPQDVKVLNFDTTQKFMKELGYSKEDREIVSLAGKRLKEIAKQKPIT